LKLAISRQDRRQDRRRDKTVAWFDLYLLRSFVWFVSIIPVSVAVLSLRSLLLPWGVLRTGPPTEETQRTALFASCMNWLGKGRAETKGNALRSVLRGVRTSILPRERATEAEMLLWLRSAGTRTTVVQHACEDPSVPAAAAPGARKAEAKLAAPEQPRPEQPKTRMGRCLLEVAEAMRVETLRGLVQGHAQQSSCTISALRVLGTVLMTALGVAGAAALLYSPVFVLAGPLLVLGNAPTCSTTFHALPCTLSAAYVACLLGAATCWPAARRLGRALPHAPAFEIGSIVTLPNRAVRWMEKNDFFVHEAAWRLAEKDFLEKRCGVGPSSLVLGFVYRDDARRW